MEKSFTNHAMAVAQAICWWGALFGVVLLLAHFYTIRYLPRFDLISLMGTVASVAGLGFTFLAAMSMLLVLPGVALVLCDDAGVIEKMPRRDAPDLSKEEFFARRRTLFKHWSIGTILAIAFIAFLIFVGASVLMLTIILWASLFLWCAAWLLAEVMGFTPANTDISDKPHHGAGKVLCDREESSARSSSIRQLT